MTISRRRFIAIGAAAAGTVLLARSSPVLPLWEWRGTALGAEASLRLAHPDRAAARRLITASLAELDRLEAIFSLYRPDSALVRLNRTGGLDAPPMELVEVLGLARWMSMRSRGVFDVTVQPLWDLYAAHFATAGADPAGPPPGAIAARLPLIGWQAVMVSAARVTLTRPGAAVTLNSIGQGYISDRIADLLRRAGLTSVLVDMGEVAAVGARPDGRPWRVALEGAGEIGLVDGAVATSAADGTRFSPFCHHIFDPHTGRSAPDIGPVSVLASRAALANALSTAIAAGAICRPVPGTTVIRGAAVI